MLKTLILYLPVLIPGYLVKFSFFGIPTNIAEIAVVLLAILYVIFYVDEVWADMKSIFTLKNAPWLIGAILLFLLIILPSVLIVPQFTTLIDGMTVRESMREALGILKSWLIIPLIYFFLLFKSVRRLTDVWIFLYAYIFSCAPLVLWGLYQFVTGDFITVDARASGPFVSANYLALYMAPAVLLLLIFVVRDIVLKVNPLKLFGNAFLAPLYLLVLITTHSFAALGAVFLAAFIFLVLDYFQLKKEGPDQQLMVLRRILALSLIVIFLIGALSSAFFASTEKWQSFMDFASRSSSGVRLEVYTVAGSLLLSNPLLGIGLGQFESIYNLHAAQILHKAPYEWVMLHPHNTFLAVWLNLGFLGFAAFIYLIYLCFQSLFTENNYAVRSVKIVGLCMLCVLLLHGLVDTHIFKNDLSMLFVITVAACLLPRASIVKKMNS